MSDALTGIFDGVRVLELGQYVAAPVAAELLAHGGAEVIKVEPIAGDITRFTDPIPDARDPHAADGRQYIIKARGKRGLPVDLRHEDGLAVVREIATQCDVVLTNMRPGSADKLGLGFDDLRANHPALVYGEVSGFGDTGPHAGRPSVDLIAQSWTGLRAAGGIDDTGVPGYYEPFYCDYIAGLLLAFGIAGALRHAERTGQGQRVATSLAHAGLFAQHRTANLFESTDGWKRELVDRRHAGESLESLHHARSRVSPNLYFMTTYRTRDGAVAIGAAGALAARLCELFNLDNPTAHEHWSDRAARSRLLADARDQLADNISDRLTADVVAAVAGAGIPVSEVRLLEEVLVDPAAHEAGLVYETTHPRVGTYIMPTAPLTMSETDYSAKSTLSALGEHTNEVLRTFGYDDATIDRLVADGAVHRAE